MKKSLWMKVILLAMLLLTGGFVFSANAAAATLGEGIYTVGEEIPAGLTKFSVADGSAQLYVMRGTDYIVREQLESDSDYYLNQFTVGLKAGDQVELIANYGPGTINVGAAPKLDLNKVSPGLYEIGTEVPAGTFTFKTNSLEDFSYIEILDKEYDYQDTFYLNPEDSAEVKVSVGDKVYVFGATGTISMKQKILVPQSVSLNKTALSLMVNRTAQVAATVAPSTAIDKNVVWKSSNPAVASIDAKGNVKGIKTGTATITATARAAGAVSKSIPVTVTKVVPASLQLNKSAISIANKQVYKVSAAVSPADASVKTVAWKSSNLKVATVDAYGNIKGAASGSATITATAKGNTKVYKTVAVKVSAKTVKLNKTSLTVLAGKSAALTAAVSPADSIDKSVVWKSSNTKIATVDSKGKVTGKAKGTATVTATVKNAKAAAAKITVTPPVLATSVKLSKASITLGKGKTYSLTAVVSPSSTTNKTVTWKSSNAKIATVNSKGQVKAVNAGTAKITAVTANGKSTSATITVPYVKSLGAGKWKGGTSIPAGRYRITTTSGSGNLFITSKDYTENRNVNEILTSEDDDWGVRTVTTDIKSGDSIEIMGLDSVQFTKVTNVKSNTLHAGNWTVGKDIYAGRYRITTSSGSGNLFIYRGDYLLVNELLSAKKEDYYVTSVTQTLKAGDIIEISSMEKVVFTKN